MQHCGILWPGRQKSTTEVALRVDHSLVAGNPVKDAAGGERNHEDSNL